MKSGLCIPILKHWTTKLHYFCRNYSTQSCVKVYEHLPNGRIYGQFDIDYIIFRARIFISTSLLLYSSLCVCGGVGRSRSVTTIAILEFRNKIFTWNVGSGHWHVSTYFGKVWLGAYFCIVTDIIWPMKFSRNVYMHCLGRLRTDESTWLHVDIFNLYVGALILRNFHDQCAFLFCFVKMVSIIVNYTTFTIIYYYSMHYISDYP